MICSRNLRAGWLAAALALMLGGCVGENNAAAPDAARKSDPAVTELLGEADTAMAGGALADASRVLDKAQRLAPDDPDVWVAIARLRFRGGEHLFALDAADRALALGPGHAPALLMRAFMVRDAHGPAAALPWFEAALAANPDNADVWAEYAASLGDSGRSRAMLRASRKLAEIAPEDPRVFYLQAVLAARGGNQPLARSLLVRSGMAEREVPAAMQLDAILSLAEGNPNSAAATLDTLAARQPGNARLRDLLARALLMGGRDAELVARFGAEAQRAEASPYLILLTARAYERLGDRARAAPLLARAYGGALRTPMALADRAGLPQPTSAMRQAVSAANWREARALAQNLRARFPASSDVANLSGDALLGAGDLRGALESYALTARIRRPLSLTRKVVFASRRAGDGVAADTLLARHVAGEPLALSGLVEAAHAEMAREDWARAAVLLDQAIRQGGGHDPALLTLRIKTARAQGQSAEARQFAMLLAEIRPRQLARP